MNLPFTCPRTCPLVGERWCRFRPITDLLGPVKVDSNVARIDLTITDLDALEAACRNLGLILTRGQTSYRWFGQFMGDSPLPEGMTVDDLGKCLHAISVPGNTEAYEIGVIQHADGTYGLVWDFYDGGCGMEAFAGPECKKIIAEYPFAIAERAANAQGWLHERTEDGLRVYHPSGGTLAISTAGVMDAAGFVGEACHDAMLAMGLKLDSLTAKPEYGQVQAQARCGG